MTSKEELINSIDRVAILTNELATLEATQDAEIITIREKFGPRLTALKEEVKSLTKAVKRYVTAKRKSLLGGRQSAETPQAIYGFRKGNISLTLIKGWTEADVIAEIRALKSPFPKGAIVITEKLNRGALTTLTDDQLEQIGLQRKQAVSFFIEPKQDAGERQTA